MGKNHGMNKRASVLALLLALVFAARSLRPASSPPDGAVESARYTVLMMDRAVGVQTSSLMPGGERRYFFQYNDRGRGPRISSRIVLGPSGVPAIIENLGYDYFKNRVVERFAVERGKAAWRNRQEQGERAAPGRAFYVSMSGVPEEAALLARALLAAPDGKLGLLPEGEAHIERVGDLKVAAGVGGNAPWSSTRSSGSISPPRPSGSIRTGRCSRSVTGGCR